MADVRQYEQEPLEVFAIDASMNRATGSIPYVSLQWLRRYSEPGQFVLVVPANVYDPSWAYVYTADRPETGMIQKVEYSDAAEVEDGIDTVTVSGFFMEEILNRMVFLVEEIELEKVIVPAPSRAGMTESQQPTYYTDDAGNLYYKDKSGYFTKSDGTKYEADGCYPIRQEVMEELAPGFKELDYFHPWDQYKPENNPTGITPVVPAMTDSAFNYYYETPEDKASGTITRVRWDGEKTTLDNVLMRDDKGNALYEASNGEKRLIWGVVDSKDDTYFRQREEWERKIEGIDDEGHGYYMKEVMGPWSTLELDDLKQAGDNVRLVTYMVRKKMQNLFLYDEPAITGEEKALQDYSLSRVGDFAYKELGTVGASYRVFYSFEHNEFVFQTWRGKDRTQDQSTWPWAVFSDTWGTLHGFTASTDDSNYRNKCYVLYEYDCPSGWVDGMPATDWKWEKQTDGDGYNRKYYIPYETKRGIVTVRLNDGKPDMECYLDLRKEAPEHDKSWSRDEKDGKSELFDEDAGSGMEAEYAAFWASLEERGNAMLTQDHGEVTTLDTGTLDAWRYMDAWDLGDKVDMAVNAIGIVESARITGVDEVYESGKTSITLTIGDELLTFEDKAAL